MKRRLFLTLSLDFLHSSMKFHLIPMLVERDMALGALTLTLLLG